MTHYVLIMAMSVTCGAGQYSRPCTFQKVVWGNDDPAICEKARARYEWRAWVEHTHAYYACVPTEYWPLTVNVRVFNHGKEIR